MAITHTLSFTIFLSLFCLAQCDIPNVNKKQPSPNPLPGFHADIDEISISAGHFHTCAISEKPHVSDSQDEEHDDEFFGGSIQCWGDKISSSENPPPPGGTFVQISSGHGFTCALNRDESVRCWGSNVSATTTTTPPPGLFLQVGSGESHACAVGTNGLIVCWGRNDFGEGSPPPGVFVQVSCGKSHGCGLRPSGKVECWGQNSYGSPPDDVLFKQISVSMDSHACGITLVEEDIQCWGNNNRGQAKSKKGPFLQVSTGTRSTCAIREDQSIVCWGIPSIIPEDETNMKIYDQITLGQGHVCAVDMESQLHCWDSGMNTGSDRVPLGLVVR